MTDMLALAAARRSGQHLVYDATWGAAIGKLQDLKTLELILETFSVKQRQLDTVVECAKTWKFPLRDTQHELSYDERAESMQWTKASDEETADDSVREEGLHRSQETIHDNQEGGNVSGTDGIPDESTDMDGSFEPGWHLDEEGEDNYGGTSPVFNADDYADDWEIFPYEPWMRNALDLEVRIVRFRRKVMRQTG